MNIKTKFSLEDRVYAIHDINKIPRMITGIFIRSSGISYECSSGDIISTYYEFELTDNNLDCYLEF